MLRTDMVVRRTTRVSLASNITTASLPAPASRLEAEVGCGPRHVPGGLCRRVPGGSAQAGGGGVKGVQWAWLRGLA